MLLLKLKRLSTIRFKLLHTFIVKETMKKITLEENNIKVPFKVPQNYFEELPKRIQETVLEDVEKPVFTVSWSWKRTLITSMAASVVGFLIWVTYPKKQYSIGEETLSSVKDENIIKYLKESEIEPSELLVNENINSYSIDSTMINDLEITDEDILKHLDAETIKENI